MINPIFYYSNTDSFSTPTEKGWYIAYSTESGDKGAMKVDRGPTNNKEALEMLLQANPDECYNVSFFAEVF